MSDLITLERDEARKFAVVSLNRADKINAFNNDLLDGLMEALTALADDDSVSAVIIRGEGKNFSAGYDVVSGYAAGSAYDDWRNLQNKIDLWERVYRFPKPLIAAVEGHCLGGATMLVACCDLVVVSEDANIGWPSIPLGGGLLSPVSLWHIGMRKAKELSFIAGNSMTGTEAFHLGWANRAVAPGTASETARTLATQVGKTPLDLLYLKKQALNKVYDRQGFVESLRSGAEWDAISHTAASIDGIKALMKEKGLKGAIKHFTAS
ncbi:enoyl-CoA hydratase/isomerase family protein [Dietzia natronolimnaea]|uniref:enoyl-CoA hydratase/isomerase family protein n=1 Tax=Dietzia natronolimnaea TaxID=161920 RepID=UPI0015FBAEDA|nr:enoyl-CoA hydratase/isomerase family protein [Dietzia natronolimnaea]MBB1037683.1 enoyl-CoA hydratase/isomerase family protein [Dietzia natronolimnaea]